MKRKRRKAALMPRLGPPQNLRPAGAHEPRTRYNRKRAKAALKRYDEDGFFAALREQARVGQRCAGYTPIIPEAQ